MARHSGGWVKLWRALKDHPASVDGYSLAIFVWFLLEANRSTSRVKFNGHVVTIGPGSLVMGILKLARRMKFTKWHVESRIKWLAKTESIQIESGREGSIVTICNWERWQAVIDEVQNETGTKPERSLIPIRNETGTKPDPIGEGEEVEKERIEELSPRRPRVVYRYDGEDLKGAEWLQAEIKARNPNARRIDSANLEAWAQEIRLMREQDSLTHHQIAETAVWALNDTFWRAQIQSPSSLRSQWDVLTSKMQKRRGGF